MEQGVFEDDEPKFPCLERCPYIFYGDRHAREAIAADAAGALCVSDPAIDYNLRLYQVRDCEGAEEWDPETGSVFCNYRSQVFSKEGDPQVRIGDEHKQLAWLQRHNASLWKRIHTESIESFIRTTKGHIRSMATSQYPPEEVAFARLGTTPELFATERSHPDLTDDQREELSQKMKRMKEVSDAVTTYDRFMALIRQRMSFSEAVRAIVAENAASIKAGAAMQLRFELHQIKRDWF